MTRKAPRPTGITEIVGFGSLLPGGHLKLAMMAANLARALGHKTLIKASKVRGSVSRHLVITEPGGREWFIRISDHRRHENHRVPHLDLVSRNGVDGHDVLDAYVRTIINGTAKWFDAVGTEYVPPTLETRRVKRSRETVHCPVGVHKKTIKRGGR